jgi:hypothetical protein
MPNFDVCLIPSPPIPTRKADSEGKRQTLLQNESVDEVFDMAKKHTEVVLTGK